MKTGVLYRLRGRKFEILLYKNETWGFVKGDDLEELYKELGYDIRIGDHNGELFLVSGILQERKNVETKWMTFSDAQRLLTKSYTKDSRNDLIVLQKAGMMLLGGNR